MTREELNEHLRLVQALEELRELLRNVKNAAELHTYGKNCDYATEIADLKVDIKNIKDQIIESEKQIHQWLQTIEDDTIRKVFSLRFLCGMQWKEVAGMVGKYCSEASVKMMCYRYLDRNKTC